MTNIRFDSAALGRVLRSREVASMVKNAAEDIAQNVESQGLDVGAFKGSGEIALPVQVRTETTDRASASVVLAHPAGIAVQAKYGALTRAASAAGLEVRGD